MSRWVPYAISSLLSFSRDPLGIVMMTTNYVEETKKVTKEELRKLAWDTVKIIRNAMMSGLIGPSNTERVGKAKGHRNATYDTGALMMATQVRVVQETKGHGVGWFAGVPETAGVSDKHPGLSTTNFWGKKPLEHSPLPLFELAKMTLAGYDAIHPRSKTVFAKVPPRNFLEPGIIYAKSQFDGELIDMIKNRM